MDTQRPLPDALQAAPPTTQKDESRQARGRLKIFFGMAAGVGKTYAMLEAALAQKAAGADVVVGIVETHQRRETESMLDMLEVIPRCRVAVAESTAEEMDTDAIIARAPDLVLIDELAHTNAPESRHTRRYQDVIEILEHGIDVYTTVNVQHFESRADAVQQITGSTVQETVPDSLLDLADSVELIDLSPDDLRRRLFEGRVYTPERVEVAANSFFRTGNLTALREMALRLTAEHVDHQLQDYMQLKRIAGPWKSGERLMVAVGPSPFSERLIRWTRRTAYSLEAAWLAIYVQTSDPLPPEAKDRLAQNLALARELGGEIVTTGGDDITEAMLRIARQRNVTQLVVGKPQQPPWRNVVRGGSLVDKLIRRSGEIDIYVVTGDEGEQTRRRYPLLQTPTRHSTGGQYLLALLAIAAVTLLDVLVALLAPEVGYQIFGFTELLAVLMIAVFVGRGPALAAAAASALLWNFLFIEPRFTLQVRQVQDIVLVALYFLTALIAGNLTARIRSQERAARLAADQSMALYTLAHQIATAVDMDSVLTTAVAQIGVVFDAQVAILLADEHGLATLPHLCSTLHVDNRDAKVAQWVYEHGKPAGRYTDTLAVAGAQYRPLLTPSRTVGVIGIRPHKDERLSFDQEVLLETFINQVSLVIEREMLDEAAEQAAMLRESERLYGTLLNSISHELRTPIAAILGAVSSLKSGARPSDDVSRGELADDIQTAANRLNRLVENLLDMSRLESGRLVLKLDWGDIGDVIGVLVKRFEPRFADHPLTVDVPPDLPLLKMDFVLLEQALANLVDNALNYTPPGTPIRIESREVDGSLEIIIQDRGPGIPEEALPRVFDKFYRAPGTAAGGTGLGLSISKGLIEAHGGTMSVGNAPQGGARFTIRLPLKGAPPPVTESAYAQ